MVLQERSCLSSETHSEFLQCSH